MKKIAAFVTLLTLVSSPAAAYKVNVHEKMTEQAARASLLNDRLKDYGISVGVLSVDDRLNHGYDGQFGGTQFIKNNLSVVEWMQLGAKEEDDFVPPHFLKHFYNPLFPAGAEGLNYLGKNMASLDWGLERESHWLQQYSLRDAKTYLYEGILGSDEDTRKWNLIQLFRALGHFVHLIQDLAQPQHTRDDAHPPWNSSIYEKWTSTHILELRFAGYPAVEMSTPEMYWTTCARGVPCSNGRGLANYSNRGFITEGTNFSGNTEKIKHHPDFPFPNGNGMKIERRSITELFGSTGSDEKLTGEHWFIQTPVIDYNDDSINTEARVSTFALLDSDLGEDGVFTFNNFNSESIHRLLVPRAVGYSAGILNRFFRGKIEITLPDLGAYAYADHSSAKGFSTVRATIKNATPKDAMMGGELIAVVKFHRNGCYKPDLSGEFTKDSDGKLQTPCPNYRSEKEEMVRSTPQTVSRLESGEQREFTFDFSTPIPMNATDVYMQVVYRGPLGQEEDGIAVGARDISEPTFFTIVNATDMYQLPISPGSGYYEFFYSKDIKEKITESPYLIVDRNRNGWYDPPYDENVDGGDIFYEVSLNGGKGITKIATIPALPMGRFSRFAFLVDSSPFKISLLATGAGFFMSRSEYVSTVKVAQLDYLLCNDTHTQCPYRVGPVDKLRELYRFGAFIYWHGHQPGWSGFKDLPKSNQPDATKPVPAELVTPTLLTEPLPRSIADEPFGNSAISVVEPPEPSHVLLIHLPK